MRKVWVLDTETKGTGAQMVPLDKVEEKAASAGRAVIVPRERPAPEEKPAGPKAPPRFKLVDVMTRQVLAEGAGTREAVDVLRGLRSVVDVSVYVWDERTDTWRPLSMGERKALWNLRGEQPAKT